MAGCSTLLVTVLIASVGEALPEIIHSIPKDSDSRLYGVEACGGWGQGVEADKKKIQHYPIIKHMRSHCRVQGKTCITFVTNLLLRSDTYPSARYKINPELLLYDRETPLFRSHLNCAFWDRPHPHSHLTYIYSDAHAHALVLLYRLTVLWEITLPCLSSKTAYCKRIGCQQYHF